MTANASIVLSLHSVDLSLPECTNLSINLKCLFYKDSTKMVENRAQTTS